MERAVWARSFELVIDEARGIKEAIKVKRRWIAGEITDKELKNYRNLLFRLLPNAVEQITLITAINTTKACYDLAENILSYARRESVRWAEAKWQVNCTRRLLKKNMHG